MKNKIFNLGHVVLYAKGWYQKSDDVSFNIGLDLNKLEQKLDDILIKETKESLTEWLSSKRNKLYTKDEIKQLLWKGYIKDYKLLLPEKIMDKILPSFEKWIENSLK